MFAALLFAAAAAWDSPDHPFNQCSWTPGAVDLRQAVISSVSQASTAIYYCPECSENRVRIAPFDLSAVEVKALTGNKMAIRLNGEHFDPFHTYFTSDAQPPFKSARLIAADEQCPVPNGQPVSIDVDEAGVVAPSVQQP